MPLVCSDPSLDQSMNLILRVRVPTLREFILISLELVLELPNLCIVLVEQDLDPYY